MASKREIKLRPLLLDRYVAGEYLFGYMVALFVVMLLRLLIDVFIFFDEFIETDEAKGAGGVVVVIGYLLDYYIPKLFEYYRDFSGMIILLAATFSLVRMARNNELTAILASGISLKRIFMPIVLLGLLFNLIMVADQELILPRLADKLVRHQDDVTQVRKVPVWFLPDQEESLLCARRYNREELSMEHMLVIIREDQRMVGRITAEKGIWDEERQQWRLIDGRLYRHDAANVVGDQPPYTTLEYYESELTANDIWVQRHSGSKSLMSSRDLSELLKRRLKPADRAEAISEKHFRFTDPIINMVMLFLGLPMLISREQRGTKAALIVGVLGSGGCFVAAFACKLLAGAGLSPLLAAWLPIIIFLPVSVLTLEGLKT